MPKPRDCNMGFLDLRFPEYAPWRGPRSDLCLSKDPKLLIYMPLPALLFSSLPVSASTILPEALPTP